MSQTYIHSRDSTSLNLDFATGFKRRNSTSVSSIKLKNRNPPVQVVVDEHKSLSNSIDEGDEEVFGDGNLSGSRGLLKIASFMN